MQRSTKFRARAILPPITPACSPPKLKSAQLSSLTRSSETVAFDRTIEEGLYLVVDLRTQPADLVLGDAAHPHRLDQVVEPTKLLTPAIGGFGKGMLVERHKWRQKRGSSQSKAC